MVMGDTCTYTYTPTLRGAPIHDILSDEVHRYVNFSHKIHVQSNIHTYISVHMYVRTYVCSHFTTLLQMFTDSYLADYLISGDTTHQCSSSSCTTHANVVCEVGS